MKISSTPSLCGVILVLATATSVKALNINGYNALQYNRFVSGFSSGPIVPNTDPAFTLAGYDLSGVGWHTLSNAFGVTLISPQHGLTASHVSPGIGTTVSFLGADGVVRAYTVSSVTNLTYAGAASDASLVRFSTPVDTAYIKSYSGLFLGSDPLNYVGVPVTMYGSQGRVGLNTIDDIGNFDLLPFGGGDTVTDSVITLMDFDATPGQAQGQAGDSGSPTFARIDNGDLALVGVHSAIGSISSTAVTLDSLPLFTSQAQINALLSADGYPNWTFYTSGVVAPIPEPSASVLAGAFGALAIVACRRRPRRS